ncbi:hypothetical protein Tco_1254569 [Tanacetum coccineum]
MEAGTMINIYFPKCSVTYIQDDDDILMSGIDKNGDLIHGEEEIKVESGEENEFDSANDLCRSFGYSLIGKTFDSADDAYDFYNEYGLSKECKDLVTLLSKEGIRPSEITKIVNAYRGNHEDKLTRVQCSTIVSGERRRNLGKECHGVIMHFKERAEVDKDFYFAMDLSTDRTLRNVFWADGRQQGSKGATRIKVGLGNFMEAKEKEKCSYCKAIALGTVVPLGGAV